MKTFCTETVYRNLKSENYQDYAQVHEFGFRKMEDIFSMFDRSQQALSATLF
jgi:hypothetical protein